MLHIFKVHSSITYLMAAHIVKTCQIPIESVVLVISRSFSPPADNPYRTVQSPYPHDGMKVQAAFWKSWSALRQFDQWLENEVCQGIQFYWYAEHSYSNIFHLTINHPLCLGYYYFEEGSIVYCPDESWAVKKSFNPLRSLLYWLNFGNRNPAERHFFTTTAKNYLGCFGIAEQSFGRLPKKNVIGFPFAVRHFDEPYECLIVHDNLYDQFPPETYLPWIAAMFEDAIRRGFQQIHHKFHPAQKENTTATIEQFIDQHFSKKILTKKLDKSARIEEIIISQQPLVYVCVSSVGIYAHLAKAKVLSILKICQKQEPLFSDYAKLLPAFFLENIEYL